MPPGSPGGGWGGPAARVLAALPHMLGYVPDRSMVVAGLGHVLEGLRFDLPGPGDRPAAAAAAAHAAAVLRAAGHSRALAAGYGPEPLVAPAAAQVARAMRLAGIALDDLVRVENGLSWSYLHPGPPAGRPVPGLPAAEAARFAPVLASRSELARLLEPLPGPAAAAAREATARAARQAARMSQGRRASEGIAATRRALRAYRQGGMLTSPDDIAELAVLLAGSRVRAVAWALMTPGHSQEHRRLWADVTAWAQPGYVAAPASLLALTAWQCGLGAMANIALDRALADSPRDRAALLLRESVAAGLPPTAAVPGTTPARAAALYARPRRRAAPGRTGGGPEAGR